ncbi:TipAS antibiotic-recognition domain-containing protein [Saccharopolyspora endophytica]|uniref:TipAS antibiotic-recognition domain-containing protein n=1 Tax=Saccharopolyspora endophytica TaxID=543886 RepID=A0ABS5DG96_9PSEU|nr:TipAS antibiotic-recognition domain-containing protein [Saccharopolyspora endophytica]MBQ0925317.1 TipAS antibiotic-recognition domain-containing protein [Saccharopolyspora endophytica]
MQPNNLSGSAALEQTEAVEDGTALIGNLTPSGAGNLSPAQKQAVARKIGEDWQRISSTVAELFATGVPSNDPRTQQIVHEHYQWLGHFWTPDRASYLRLAEMYVNQPKFRHRIERRKPKGMASYLRDAMTTYAWSRLR